MNKKSKSLFLLTTVFLLAISMSMLSTPALGETAARAPFSDKEAIWDLTSGYADELYFRVILGDEQNVLALQAGEIDIIGQFVAPDLVPPLLTDPNIEINQTNRIGFGHVSFNCHLNPTNFSELRQAFSHALDKDGIQVLALGGYSRPVDSCIPPSCGFWSLDNDPDFVTNYYEPNPVVGNALLDANGWDDLDSDGWREDPNGNAVEIPIMGSNTGSAIIETVVAMSVEAFESIGIKARADLIDFNTLLARVNDASHTQWNAGFWAFNLGLPEPRFLQNFVTGNIGNDWAYSNADFDSNVTAMFNTMDVDEATEYALNAQRILWEEQPLSVAYQNLLISAYRKDPWTGLINSEGSGVFRPSTFTSAYLKPEFGGTSEDYLNYKQGGRFTCSLPQQMESTNILNSNSAYTFMTLNMVYDGMYGTHPYTLEDIPSMAKDWDVEEINATDPDLTAHPNAEVGDALKITYYLHEGFTWHDGEPVTANDYAYSFELVEDSGSPVYLTGVQDVTHVEVVNDYEIEVYADVAGLFTFHRTLATVWPEHIWSEVASPLTWANPNPIGCGPYRWKSRTPGELVVLERNDDYFYNPRNYKWLDDVPVINTTTTDTTTTVAGAGAPGFEFVALFTGFAVIALVEKKRKR